jgi:adenylate cyclase
MAAMATIRVEPDGESIPAKEGKKLLDCILKAGIPHTHACGGNARCTTCRVLVLAGSEQLGDPTWKETRIAKKLGFGAGFRLACQTTVKGDARVRRLVLDPEDVALTDYRDRAAPVGDEREVAVMFSDIRNFTPLAETLLPYDVIHLLNRHYYEMGRIIAARGGHITAYMGDGLMALFGMSDESHDMAASDAVLAGIEMLERQDERQGDLEMLYSQGYEINVGIHTGEAVVGVLGGDVSVMTAIGDVVNVASRIESANKQVGSRMLISEETYGQTAEVIEIGRKVSLGLKGKTGTFSLYEVLGAKNTQIA